ncbi:GntR family transcriptional regulator [Sphingosinicella terrae]|uniref:GntR family transcriptional regulator n=1 Tax=Sphingosinicella terrae TaxID=2172047 RepID=UPI000E0DAE44|nr:GntR family transcriptional regulator [Sphingosinicella terrae]
MGVAGKAKVEGARRPQAGPAARDVVDWIRDRIRVGRFVPGQRLVEADITRETGAARSRVREALQRLETEGLVAIEEFRGASVKQFSFDEVRQIYRARMALEGLAAGEFAAHGTAEQKARLAGIQQELDQWEASGDHDRFAGLNTAWHQLIIEGSGNDYIRQFLARLSVPVYRLLFTTFYSVARIRNANADHRKITAAIVEGRVEEAERAMRDHVNQGLQALSELNSNLYR